MSSESHPGRSKTEKPTRQPLWPRERLSQVFAVVILVMTVASMVEFLFRLLRSQHFLRDAAYEDAIKPYAYLLGIVLAACFAWVMWKSKDFAHNKGKFDSTLGQAKFALLLIVSPVMGFGAGWIIVTLWVPVAQHHFASKTEAQIPFTISGFTYGRHCRGVRAVNPQFYDDELCGVKRPGHSDEWRGLTIVVTGRQSRYGLTMDRYRVDQRRPNGRRPTIQEAFRRCVMAPANAPKPFDAVFQIVVDGKGEVRSMRVLSFRSTSSPAHEAAARSIISGFKACSHFRDVPAGTYALPVVVTG